jgi:hypothetical protein
MRAVGSFKKASEVKKAPISVSFQFSLSFPDSLWRSFLGEGYPLPPCPAITLLFLIVYEW